MRFVAAILGSIALFGDVILSAAEPEFIRVASDKKSFTLSGKPFVVRGFNYDHDEEGRLIEDYWEAEWPKVESDFAEMKELGANVVRVHLQVSRFLTSADKPNDKSLAQLAKLVQLAEKTGLTLDVTGLGCYHKQDVPAWYDELDEAGRWKAQAVFWEAVAKTCAASPAIFCYDLMNEPVVPNGDKPGKEWLGPPFAGKHFVQWISRDRAGRERAEIAAAWIKQLSAAIRKHDARHLITVGLVDWSLDRPGLYSGFAPEKACGELDFIAVHLYPKKGKLEEDLATLKAFDIGKPVIIEETFPLHASLEEFTAFLDKAKPHSAGFVGFYWGKTPVELAKSEAFVDKIVLKWLEVFQKAK